MGKIISCNNKPRQLMFDRTHQLGKRRVSRPISDRLGVGYGKADKIKSVYNRKKNDKPEREHEVLFKKEETRQNVEEER